VESLPGAIENFATLPANGVDLIKYDNVERRPISLFLELVLGIAKDASDIRFALANP
jgi:hypothetical protein